MSYTVLARRYRSSTFDEVIGQAHIAQTLKKAMETDRIAHAFLFCGTRGTGKTSTARILAKCLNCEKNGKDGGPVPEPCNKCESCLGIARGDDIDVIEIDAASNTGVDNIRELIENAQYRPARSRFKVYIIDEVHMLSKSAFNALLKTLEEPPSHVKFILATTEPEKVLPTILSRCQRYDFRNIPTREIAAHLAEISRKEKIKADDDALLLVAKAGAGSMRDSLSLLDRLLSVGEKKLTVDMIEQLLGMPKSQLIFDLCNAIGSGDVKTTLMSVDAMLAAGHSSDGLLAALVEHLRNLLILGACGVESNLVDVPGMSLEELATQAAKFDPIVLSQDIAILEELRRHVRHSQGGRALLDATLVRLALAAQFTSIAELLSQVDGGGSATSGAGQKKKSELTPTIASASAPPPPRTGASPASLISRNAATFPLPEPAPENPAPRPAESSPAESSAAESSAAPARHAHLSVEATTAPEPIQTNAIDTISSAPNEDEDDDLPRPGKVWSDGTGPSLSTLLSRHSAVYASTPPARPAPTAKPVPPAGEPSNLEPIAPDSLPAQWAAMLSLLGSHVSLPALLDKGRFIGVEDERVVIRYRKSDEHIIKLLERNGKKELVRDAFVKVLQKNVGIRFELDIQEPDADAKGSDGGASAGASKAAGASQSPGASRAGGDSQAGGAPKPGRAPQAGRASGIGQGEPLAAPSAFTAPAVRLTPELRAQLEADPFIKCIIEELGANIIKVD